MLCRVCRGLWSVLSTLTGTNAGRAATSRRLVMTEPVGAAASPDLDRDHVLSHVVQ